MPKKKKRAAKQRAAAEAAKAEQDQTKAIQQAMRGDKTQMQKFDDPAWLQDKVIIYEALQHEALGDRQFIEFVLNIYHLFTGKNQYIMPRGQVPSYASIVQHRENIRHHYREAILAMRKGSKICYLRLEGQSERLYGKLALTQPHEYAQKAREAAMKTKTQRTQWYM